MWLLGLRVRTLDVWALDVRACACACACVRAHACGLAAVMIIVKSPHHSIICGDGSVTNDGMRRGKRRELGGPYRGGAPLLKEASEGVRAVNVFGAGQATVLDLTKHHVLLVDLASLDELHALVSSNGGSYTMTFTRA